MNSSFEKIRNIQNNNNNNNDKSRVMKSLKIIQYSRIIPKIYRQKTKYQTLTLNTGELPAYKFRPSHVRNE